MSEAHIVDAIYQLDARHKALRLVVGLLLKENPKALEALEKLAPLLGDLMLALAVRDDQIPVAQDEIALLLGQLRSQRDSAPPEA